MNFNHRYKSGQSYDLSKRIWNAVNRDLGCAETWSEWFGEFSDFQRSDLDTLRCLQNIHCWAKVVTNSLGSSYPTSLLVTLFMEGCKFIAACLVAFTSCLTHVQSLCALQVACIHVNMRFMIQ